VAQCSIHKLYTEPKETASAVAPRVDIGRVYRFSMRKKSDEYHISMVMRRFWMDDLPMRRTTAGTACMERSIHRGIRNRPMSVCDENGSGVASTSGILLGGNMRSGAKVTSGHCGYDSQLP